MIEIDTRRADQLENIGNLNLNYTTYSDRFYSSREFATSAPSFPLIISTVSNVPVCDARASAG